MPGTETYLVVMNVGSEDELVDLSGWPAVGRDGTWLVHTSSVNSQHPAG